jgi:hypothetical protein
MGCRHRPEGESVLSTSVIIMIGIDGMAFGHLPASAIARSQAHSGSAAITPP